VPLSICNLSLINGTASKRPAFFSISAAFVPQQAVPVAELRLLTTAWTIFLPLGVILVRMDFILREKRMITRRDAAIDLVLQTRNLGKFGLKKDPISVWCSSTTALSIINYEWTPTTRTETKKEKNHTL
jgi:hypothetical protein